MSISVGGISVFAPILYSKCHLRTRSVFLDRSCRRLVEVGLVDCLPCCFVFWFLHSSSSASVGFIQLWSAYSFPAPFSNAVGWENPCCSGNNFCCPSQLFLGGIFITTRFQESRPSWFFPGPRMKSVFPKTGCGGMVCSVQAMCRRCGLSTGPLRRGGGVLSCVLIWFKAAVGKEWVAVRL